MTEKSYFVGLNIYCLVEDLGNMFLQILEQDIPVSDFLLLGETWTSLTQHFSSLIV